MSGQGQWLHTTYRDLTQDTTSSSQKTDTPPRHPQVVSCFSFILLKCIGKKSIQITQTHPGLPKTLCICFYHYSRQESMENTLKRISTFSNIQRHLRNYGSLHLRAKLLRLVNQPHTKSFYNRQIRQTQGLKLTFCKWSYKWRIKKKKKKHSR